MVTQSSGRVVPVVQAFWGTKYLGFIRLSFSENGELSSWNNTWRNSKTPILLDGSYKQGMLKIIDKLKIYSKKFNKSSEQYKTFQFADPTVLEKIRPWKQQLTELGNDEYL